MKKVLVFLLCIIFVGVIVSCDVNAPLRRKMLAYYNNDSNYSELTGRIVTASYSSIDDILLLEVDILTESHDYPLNAETGYGEFAIVYWSAQDYHLYENDIIQFSSAPMYFYNGHVLPAVSLHHEEKELLAFAEGKESYIKWINANFE